MGLTIDLEDRLKTRERLRAFEDGQKRRDNPAAGVDQIRLKIENQSRTGDTIDLKLCHQSILRTWRSASGIPFAPIQARRSAIASAFSLAQSSASAALTAAARLHR